MGAYKEEHNWVTRGVGGLVVVYCVVNEIVSSWLGQLIVRRLRGMRRR